MVIKVQRAFLLATAGVIAAAGSAAAQDATTQLKTIVVEREGRASSTDDRIVVKNTTSATKTNSPVLETPQSVTTVTRRQLNIQNPQTVSEALRYTAGVLSDRDSNTRYDSIFLRGFGAFGLATSYVNYLDGLKLPRGQAFAQSSIDPYLLDRIDVLKGPSGVLYGQVNPGGLVNQVSRSPSVEPFNEVRLQGGTNSRIQGGFTSRGPVTEDGTVQYGISMIGRHSGTDYDDVDEQRFAIAPSLRWQPDTDTTLTLSGYYQKDPKSGYFNSLYPDFLAPAAYRGYLDRHLNIGDPNFDSFKREQYGIGYSLEHRFNETVTVRSSLRYSHIESDFKSLQMAGPIDANGLIPRWALHSIEDVGGVSMDNQAQFDFETGAVQHQVLVGLDYQNSRSNWEYLFGGAAPLDVKNPVYGQPVGPFMTIINSGQKFHQTGIYAQDQLSFGGFRAVLGVRHDWTELDTNNRLARASSDQTDEATTYRAGLLYLFDNGVAPYASYSTSFEPEIGVNSAGNAFVPSKAQQYEIGVKYQPTGWDALFTVSAFDIRKQNALVADALGFNVQEGEIRSRGLEFEARGNLATNLELIAALTLLDTKYTETSDPTNVGNRPQAVPDYYGSVWVNYGFTTSALEGLTLGGGLRFVGSSYADNANKVKADGYTLVDAALRYDFGVKTPSLKGLEGTLNVTNLFNKDYYSSCSSNFYCQFGSGRQVLAGLNYKW